MSNIISFAEFSSNLKIGDSLFIRSSTYPKTRFPRGGLNLANAYTPDREARVVRVGKTKIDLLGHDDTKHHITTEIVRREGFNAVRGAESLPIYHVSSNRGSISVAHSALVVPHWVVDEGVYRWACARWSSNAWCGGNAHKPAFGECAFSNGALFYGRSEAEVKCKLRNQKPAAAPKSGRLSQELRDALLEIDEGPPPVLQYVCVRADLSSANEKDHRFTAWGPFTTAKQALIFGHNNFRQQDKVILRVRPPSELHL